MSIVLSIVGWFYIIGGSLSVILIIIGIILKKKFDKNGIKKKAMYKIGSNDAK